MECVNQFSDAIQHDLDQIIRDYIVGRATLDQIHEYVEKRFSVWVGTEGLQQTQQKMSAVMPGMGMGMMMNNPMMSNMFGMTQSLTQGMVGGMMRAAYTSPNDQADLFDNPSWIVNEAVLRVAQSLINQLDESRVSLSKYTELVNKFAAKSQLDKSELVSKLFAMLKPILTCSNQQFHQNVCLILLITLEGYTTLSPEIGSELLVYLMKQISESNQLETQLFGLVLIEKFWFNQKLSFEMQQQLNGSLEKFVEFDQNSNPGNSQVFHLIGFQVGFCARWYLDHVIQNPRNEPALIKLSPDLLSARSDSTQFVPVRSVFQVSSGVFYYEATLLTDGHLQIGWASKQSKFTPPDCVGNEPYSIAFDGYNRCIWQGEKHPIQGLAKWTAGSVVGCLVDADNGDFIFYLNGKQVDYQKKMRAPLQVGQFGGNFQQPTLQQQQPAIGLQFQGQQQQTMQSGFKVKHKVKQSYTQTDFGFSDFGSTGQMGGFNQQQQQPQFGGFPNQFGAQPIQPSQPTQFGQPNIPMPTINPKPYFAAATLSPHQQVYFNFGQSSFRFAPQAVPFVDFHSWASKESPVGTYQLQEPMFMNGAFYFQDKLG